MQKNSLEKNNQVPESLEEMNLNVQGYVNLVKSKYPWPSDWTKLYLGWNENKISNLNFAVVKEKIHVWLINNCNKKWDWIDIANQGVVFGFEDKSNAISFKLMVPVILQKDSTDEA